MLHGCHLWSLEPVLAIREIQSAGQRVVERDDDASRSSGIVTRKAMITGEDQTMMSDASMGFVCCKPSEVADILRHHTAALGPCDGEDLCVRATAQVKALRNRLHIMTDCSQPDCDVR